MSTQVPAGWYPDHSDPSVERLWDGAEWTDRTRPRPPALSVTVPPPPIPTQHAQDVSSLNGPRSPGFGGAIKDAFQRYADGTGRTSVSGYWWFWLFSTVLGLLTGGFSWFVTLIPAWTTGVRRMHDVNRSGWFLLIPLYNLVLLLQQGDAAANRYGPAQQ